MFPAPTNVTGPVPAATSAAGGPDTAVGTRKLWSSRQVVITISTAKDRRPTKRRFMRQGHGTSYAWNADRNRRRRESRFVVVALQLCAGALRRRRAALGEQAARLGQLGGIREVAPADQCRDDHPQRSPHDARVVRERSVPHVHDVQRELDGEQPRRVRRLGVRSDEQRGAVRRAVDAAGAGEPRQHLRSEEHTSELQSLAYLVCRLLLEKKKKHVEYVGDTDAVGGVDMRSSI